MGSTKNRPNILLITIDSLRPDFLGCYSNAARIENLSPNINLLAAKGTVFKNAISQGPRTPESFPAILSGQYVSRYRDAFSGLSSERTLISQILQKNGYTTIALNSNPYISRHSNYNKGFDVFTDNLFKSARSSLTRGIHLKYVHLKALLGEPYTLAEKMNRQLLETLSQTTSPYFAWIHYMDVHGPYISKNGLSLSNSIRGGMLWRRATHDPQSITEKDKEELIATYKEEVQYVDYHIGELLNDIDMEDTLVILTADHGEFFGEHGLYGHVPNKLYEPLLKVPLIYKPVASPEGNMESQVDTTVKLLDIVPTILDDLNIDSEIDFDGESLLPLLEGIPESYKTSEIISEVWTKFLTIRKGRWKLIANYSRKKMELYDLHNDPKESNNLATEYREVCNDLKRLIVDHLIKVKAPKDDLQQCDFKINKAIEAQLRGLGYM